jgi:hypothetical protein
MTDNKRGNINMPSSSKTKISTHLFFLVQKVLNINNIHPSIKKAEYAVRGALPIRAEELSKVFIKNEFLYTNIFLY